MRVIKDDKESLDLEGPIPYSGIANLGSHRSYKKLALTKSANFPAKYARGLKVYSEIQKLWLWSKVFRTAMPHIIGLPELETLDILFLRKPGSRLCSFSDAEKLKIFRCNTGLIESDLIAISSAPALEVFGAQSAMVTERALDALMKAPYLHSVDLEATGFGDNLAAKIAESTQITTLDLGSNPISAAGFKSICSMPQLKHLDIWHTNTKAHDLVQLENLEKLEYLSVGGYYGCDELKAEDILPIISKMPSIRRLWLDGVTLTEAQKIELTDKYEYFRN